MLHFLYKIFLSWITNTCTLFFVKYNTKYSVKLNTKYLFADLLELPGSKNLISLKNTYRMLFTLSTVTKAKNILKQYRYKVPAIFNVYFSTGLLLFNRRHNYDLEIFKQDAIGKMQKLHRLYSIFVK